MVSPLGCPVLRIGDVCWFCIQSRTFVCLFVVVGFFWGGEKKWRRKREGRNRIKITGYLGKDRSSFSPEYGWKEVIRESLGI